MEFKDYYATLGVAHDATQARIRHAYRRKARKYHPDVSKEPDAEERFKQITEANEALTDRDRRAAYDEVVAQRDTGRDTGGAFSPPTGWDSGFEYRSRGQDGDSGRASAGRSEFFEALFGRQTAGVYSARASGDVRGDDHHAKVRIDLQEAYRGGSRSISLRSPRIDVPGPASLRTRQLDVNIPKGVLDGQRLRLAGQGGPGSGTGPAGDLYLEIELVPTDRFRIEGRDVFLDLPVAPWEAALGAEIDVPTPDGSVRMTVPGGSSTGRRLRLRGQGIQSTPPGDLYAVLTIVLPDAATDADKDAYRAMARAFAGFQPRGSTSVRRP